MIRVFYTEGYSGKISHHKADFETLHDLENWIFEQMCQSYLKMSFPTIEDDKDEIIGMPWAIEFQPDTIAPLYNIHRIDNEEGIIFSDGRMTNGQKHWSRDVQKWLSHCQNRKSNPHFNFVK